MMTCEARASACGPSQRRSEIRRQEASGGRSSRAGTTPAAKRATKENDCQLKMETTEAGSTAGADEVLVQYARQEAQELLLPRAGSSLPVPLA